MTVCGGSNGIGIGSDCVMLAKIDILVSFNQFREKFTFRNR